MKGYRFILRILLILQSIDCSAEQNVDVRGRSSEDSSTLVILASLCILISIIIAFIVVFFIRCRRSYAVKEYDAISSMEPVCTRGYVEDVYTNRNRTECQGIELDGIETQQASTSELDPPYQNHEITHWSKHPVYLQNLRNYISKMKNAQEVDNFTEQYESLGEERLYPDYVASFPKNQPKNRYTNILAYDHSRVKLLVSTTGESDYINANYMDAYRGGPRRFIATQGPLKDTVNDFWRMVWDRKTTRIVMICKLIEQNRDKCAQYWPNKGMCTYGDIDVTFLKLISKKKKYYVIREFKMTKDSESRVLHQFHFTSWPDVGVPRDPAPLISFRAKVRNFDDGNTAPIIVHCRDGVGRTGTFIALDYLFQQAMRENQVDVFTCIVHMRRNRFAMVQTLEQYVFIHEALLRMLRL